MMIQLLFHPVSLFRRVVIGKNTKFKSAGNRTSSNSISAILQNVSNSFLFISFTIIAALLCPVGGSDGPDLISESNNVAQSMSDRMLYYENFSQFVGTDGTAQLSSEKSISSASISVSEDRDADHHSGPISIKVQRKAKNIIAQHVRKYKRSVESVHPSCEEESELLKTATEEFTKKPSNVTGHTSRMRRAVLLLDPQPNLARSRRKIADLENEGTFVINQLDRATPQYFDNKIATDINCQRFKQKSLVFSIETTVEHGRQIMVHQLNEKNLHQNLVTRKSAPDATSVEVFEIKDKMYAFTTVNHPPKAAGTTETINTGSILYNVNLSNNSLLNVQTIYMPFAKSSTIWTGMGSEANELFLALAPEKMVISSGITSYAVNVPLYHWQGGYFDFVSDLPASNPQSIQHFAMFSHDYLAVANYQDDTGSTSVESEIFKYYHKESRFVSFQRIKTYGAKDIKHFTFSTVDERRQEHFIAIANNCKRDETGKPQYWVQSTIMKFGNTRFLPFKSFYSYGALQFLPVEDGKKFYLVFADFQSLRLFQYNGWTFVQTRFKQFSSELSSPLSVRLRTFNNVAGDGKSYFTAASPSHEVESGMFQVDFETRNDHRKLVTSVESWCNATRAQVKKKNLSDLEQRLNSAPKVSDSHVTINGGLLFEQGLEVKQLKSQTLRIGHGRSLDTDKLMEMAETEKEFRRLSHSSLIMRQSMENVVFAHKMSPQKIESTVHFMKSVSYINDQLHVNNLTVKDRVGSVTVSHHLENLVFVDKPNKLQKIVTTGVKVNGNDVSITRLNDRSLTDYALRNPSGTEDTKQIFTGRNEFLSGIQVERELQVDGKIDGLSFTQPEFLLYQANQTFPGTTMVFSDSRINNLYTRWLNNVDVFNMYSDAVPLTGGVILEATKTFVNSEIKNAQVQSINNVPIDSLYKNAIYKNGHPTPQTLKGSVHFENIKMVTGITPVNPKINGQFDVRQDFIKTTGEQYTVKQMKFNGPTKIESLTVRNKLNNIGVQAGTSKLDLLLRNSDEQQHVALKTLQSVHFTKHTEANELVDGIDLAGWTAIQTIELKDNQIKGTLNFPGHVHAAKGVLTGSSIKQGNFDVTNVLENAARLDDEMLPGSCAMTFQELEVLGNSDIRGKVNDIKPSQWIVNSELPMNVEITGEKTFTGPVHIEKDVNANSLYGVTDGASEKENLLAVLPTVLVDNVDQTITEHVSFMGHFGVKDALCPSAVLDNVPFENLLWKKGNQVVQVETTFRNPVKTQGDIQVLGNMFTTTVNGIHIKNQIKDTVRTNGGEIGQQNVSGVWHFEKLTVTDASTITGQLGNSNIDSLFSDIVMKNSPKINLNGMSLTFEDGAGMSDVEFIGDVNGIPSSEWGSSWLLTRTDQVVHTNTEFVRPVTVQSFETPSVNGIDVKQFSESVLMIDKDENLESGPSFTFKKLAIMNLGISMPNGVNVNGIDLAKDVLLKETSDGSSQTVTGTKTFQNGMTVLGDMTTKKIKDFDIDNFVNLVNPGNNFATENLSPSSLNINGDLMLHEEPDVTSVNGKTWEELRNTYWMRDKNVALDHPVKFSSLTLQQGGIMNDPAILNGVDLKHFASHYASKSKHQKWTGKVTLENVNKIEKLTANSVQLDNDGKFNDENIVEFSNAVLKYTGDQDIVASSLSADELTVDDVHGEDENGKSSNVLINNVDMKDFMTVSGNNEVKALKQMKELKTKNLVLSKTTVIDNVNLGQWNDNAVKLTGQHDIQSPLEFDALTTTENIMVDGYMDDVKMDLNNVVTNDKDQTLPNQVTIKKSKSKKHHSKKIPAMKALAGMNFKGQVNGINVQQAISNMAFPNEKGETKGPIVVKGTTVFNAPVKMGEVTTKALFLGHDVPAAVASISRALDEVQNNAFMAKEKYTELLSVTNRMLTVSANRAVFLDHYVLTQTIQGEVTYVKALREVGYPAIAMGLKDADGMATENWLSYNLPMDVYQRQIGNRVQFQGKVTDIVELVQNSQGANMFAFAVNSDEDSLEPAQSPMETITTNNVNSVELNKSPDKLSKTFILKAVDVGTPNMRPAISQTIYGHEFKSVKGFRVVTSKGSEADGDADEIISCMATTQQVTNEMDSTVKVFCMDRTSEHLEMVQEMRLDTPSLMTSTRVHSSDTTLLTILTRSGQNQPEGLLEVWSHNYQNQQKGSKNPVQFSKQSCLPVFNAISLHSLSTSDGKTFLAVASGPQAGTEYQGSVFLYRFSTFTQQFQKVQTIEVAHPQDVKFQWLQPSNEVVLYVLSQSVTNNMQVYKRQGLSGWSLVHQFTADNGQSLEVADFTMDGMYRAQLFVTCPQYTNVYAAEFKGIRAVI